jgi:uncharacterized phage protein gp47/JayE
MMTTTYGLTSSGFTARPLLICKSDIEDALKSVFGQSIDLDPSGPLGQLVGILAERLSELWDSQQAVYSAFDPDAASDQSLDALCALTGTLRERATHSTVAVSCVGTAGTTIPSGTQFSVAGTGVKFETLASAVFAGTFTAVSIDCQAVDTGPLVALAGTLTVIETPVSGLTSVTNALDAVVGRNDETDAALRLRRETELRNPSNAALEAIRTHLLAVDGVNAAVVFENTTMVTDGDGIPPKAVNCVVSGTATTTDVAGAIFESIAAGIQAYGTSHSVTVTDTQGSTHTIAYDDATDVPCYVHITLTVDLDTLDPGAADLVLEYFQTFEDSLVMGKDLVARALGAKMFAISGVLDCAVEVGVAPSPSGTTVVIGLRELATLDTSRLLITVTPGTP